jgi:hypothetical protein
MSSAVQQLSPVPVQTPVLQSSGGSFSLGWTQWFQALYNAAKTSSGAAIYVVGSPEYPGIAPVLSAIAASGDLAAMIFTATDETFTSNPFAGLPSEMAVTIFMSCTWTTSVPLVILTAGITIQGSGRNGGFSGIVAGPTFPAYSSIVCIGDNTMSYQGTRLEDLSVDCSDIAGTVAFEMYGAAESSGARNCAFISYGLYGMYLHGNNTTNFEIEHCVTLPSMIVGNSSCVGIYANGIGGNTNYINRCTIAGATGVLQDAGVRIVSSTMHLANIHVEGSADEILFDIGSNGICEHIIGGGTTGTVNVVHIKTGGSVVLLHVSDPSAENLVQNDITGQTISVASVPNELCLYMSGQTFMNTTKEIFFY